MGDTHLVFDQNIPAVLLKSTAFFWTAENSHYRLLNHAQTTTTKTRKSRLRSLTLIPIWRWKWATTPKAEEWRLTSRASIITAPSKALPTTIHLFLFPSHRLRPSSVFLSRSLLSAPPLILATLILVSKRLQVRLWPISLSLRLMFLPFFFLFSFFNCWNLKLRWMIYTRIYLYIFFLEYVL